MKSSHSLYRLLQRYAVIFTLFVGVIFADAGNLSVEIAVLSDSYEGSVPQSSTYYLLGSPVTLICHTQDASGSVSYQWSSTSSDFFAYNSTAMFNKKKMLSAADAGIHTCTITDRLGNTGEARLEMMFSGQMIYVVDRHDNRGTLLPNNSMIFHHPLSCSHCLIEFYCFSNSTLSGVGDVIVPNNTMQGGHSGQVLVERLPYSTLHVQVPNTALRNVGIFTCRLPDSNGNTLDTSIGLYSSDIDAPSVDVSLSGYTDLTEDSSTTALVQVECYTVNSPPTTVVWKRDGQVINTRSDTYETLQVVADRIDSHYRNVLLLHNVSDVVGDHIYTCEIENVVGSTSHNISINFQVSLNAVVSATQHTGIEGEVITLTCEATTDPFKVTPELEPYITIEWTGPLWTDEKILTLSPQMQSSVGMIRTLTINTTTIDHAGMYTCRVILNGTRYFPLESVAKYHLVLKKNLTVYDPEESLIDEQHDLDDLVCTWNGTSLPEMEWLFVGNNVVSPLSMTNISWDDKVLLCRVMSNCSSQQLCKEPHLYTIKAVIISNVSILASSTSTPTAGDMFTLTCSSVSIAPAALRWISPRGETVNSMSLENVGESLNLTFTALRTSHGGVYTCVASVGGISSVQTMEDKYWLTVQIPRPLLSINADNTTVYSGNSLSIVCTVKLVETVDSPVHVDIQWNTSTTESNRIDITKEQISQLTFISTLSIDPVLFSDARAYFCTASVISSSDGVAGVPQIMQELTIDVAINVVIRASYNPPSDFTLPSPPYYRPASTVTLTCTALSDTAQPLRYQWSSTCSSCVVSGDTTRVISIDVLKSSDAGVHSCTVTDAEGHTGHASSEMTLFGAGMYISDYHYDGAISNNTAIHRGCSECPVTILCYSNSTATHSSAVFSYPPNSRDVWSQSSSYYNPIAVQRVSPSGISLTYQFTGYQSQRSGVYTCKLSDADGNPVHFSVGLYSTDVGPPDIYQHRVEYWSGSEPGFLVKLECLSRSSIPSTVYWWDNGRVVDVSQDSYNTLQMVNLDFHLSNSYFRSIMIVKSVVGGLGKHNYTCLLENVFGTSREDFVFDRDVAMIESPLETVIGDSLHLQCHTIELPSEYLSGLSIEWWGPNGTSLHGRNDIHQEEMELNGASLSRSLQFNDLRSTLDGDYTCEVIIQFLNEQYIEMQVYDLQVSGNMAITGNDAPLVAGYSRSILCSIPSSYGIEKMEWYLEGLDTIPLASSRYSTRVSLYLDATTTGLNHTTFVCRTTGVLGDFYEEITTIYIKDMSVGITVAYGAPSDFDLMSPPYFRPASSLTLTCTAHGVSQSIQYQWHSTSSQSFAYSSTYTVISRSILTSNDAGVHTCTVTDNDGTQASASIQVILYGIGLHVQGSSGLSSGGIANNTALYRQRSTLTVYCYSNSTVDSVSIIVPSGVGYSYTSQSNYSIRTSSPSGVRFYTTSYYGHPPTGIYTCRISYQHGGVQEMSFGVYSTQVGIPTLSTPAFRNFINADNTLGLGMIVCNSNNFPSTKVTWAKDGIVLPLSDSDSYQQIQRVVNRVSSAYENILILKNAFDVIGSYRYRCIIGNRFGETSRDILVTNTVDPVLIVTTPVELIYGSKTVISCIVSVPKKLYSQLVPYMTVMWTTPDFNRSTSGIIQATSDNGDSITQNLTIYSLKEDHNGEYLCKVRIQRPNSDEVVTKEASYHLYIEAVSLSTQHSPLIAGISNEVVCRVSEAGVFRMELFHSTQDEPIAVVDGANNISFSLIPDESFDDTNISCVATTMDSSKYYENSITVFVAELRHDLEVKRSSVNAVAAENFTLTCTVISDYPAMLSWTYINGDSVNVSGISISQTYIRGTESSINLHFISLRTSHGGVYVCTSQLDISSSRNYSSLHALVEVEVAPPIVTVTRETEGIVNITSTQTLRCDVGIIDEVDVPVTVDIQWNPPPFVSDHNKLSISDSTGDDSTYQSFLTIHDYSFIESGTYTCVASTTPLSGSTGISNKTAHNEAVSHLSTGLNVRVHVDYDPPSDFTLPSPPYYRPASTVTLTCEAQDAVGSVQYQWTSTQTTSFAHGLNEQLIVRNILTAFDAGTHSCTATDQLGNTGSGSTDMIIFGAGIYVQQSELISNSSVPNNTALEFTSSYCSNCRLSFYCLSNATATDYQPSVWYSYGRVYPGNSDYYIVVAETSSGLHIYNNNHNREVGIYTCEVADSNNNIIQLSIGAYSSYSSPYISAIRYTDLVHSTTSDAVATVYCNTNNYIPSSVLWQKDGEDVHVDGLKYDVIQVVTSRQSSYYRITLLIYDVDEVIDSPIYTCTVGNSAGNRSSSVTLNIPSPTLLFSVDVAPNVSISGYEVALDTDYNLVCSGNVRVTSTHLLHKLKMEDHTIVQWSNGSTAIVEGPSITITDVSASEGGLLTSTISFHPLSKGHDRLYTCSMSVHVGTTVKSDASDYRVIFDVAYFQLKFDVISCSEITERGFMAIDGLEADIKEALTTFINRQCHCGFLTTMIDHGEFHCNGDSLLGYRARVVGSSDILSSRKLMKILEQWKSNDGAFIYTGNTRKTRVWVDALCALKISSLSAPVCD